MRKMSITLKVRLICSFFENLIVMAFLPFIALYLTDMVNQAFSGIFLFILVLINFPISMILNENETQIYPKFLLEMVPPQAGICLPSLCNQNHDLPTIFSSCKFV
mgnify:CR=1 FL=1